MCVLCSLRQFSTDKPTGVPCAGVLCTCNAEESAALAPARGQDSAVSIANGLPPELKRAGGSGTSLQRSAPSTGSRAKLQRPAPRNVFHPSRPSSRYTGGWGRVCSGRHQRPARGQDSSGQHCGWCSTAAPELKMRSMRTVFHRDQDGQAAQGQVYSSPLHGSAWGRDFNVVDGLSPQRQSYCALAISIMNWREVV